MGVYEWSLILGALVLLLALVTIGSFRRHAARKAREMAQKQKREWARKLEEDERKRQREARERAARLV